MSYSLRGKTRTSLADSPDVRNAQILEPSDGAGAGQVPRPWPSVLYIKYIGWQARHGGSRERS